MSSPPTGDTTQDFVNLAFEVKDQRDILLDFVRLVANDRSSTNAWWSLAQETLMEVTKRRIAAGGVVPQ
jgi:hypothetical protein